MMTNGTNSGPTAYKDWQMVEPLPTQPNEPVVSLKRDASGWVFAIMHRDVWHEKTLNQARELADALKEKLDSTPSEVALVFRVYGLANIAIGLTPCEAAILHTRLANALRIALNGPQTTETTDHE